jgi:poly-gamma-glutamate synthesis protein (capsule biosynthesis protein)
MKNRRSGLILACFLFLAVFGSLSSLGLKWFLISTYEPELVFLAEPSDKAFYETASSFKKKDVDLPEAPSAMIVPHHLLAADLIAEAFSNLKGDDYETVILISPNHFDIGEGGVLSSAYPFDTPYGRLEADTRLFRQLAKEGVVSPNEDVFGKEHGIKGEVGFIKKYLPDAKLLPLVLRSDLSDAEADALAERLYKIARSKRVLVVLSADFSHYKTSSEAKADDKKSLEVLLSGRLERVEEAEIDTKPGLRVVMGYARKAADDFLPLNNSNSALLAGKADIKETTSYITGYFIREYLDGELPPPAAEGRIDLLFVGDLMLDRYVKDKMGEDGPSYSLAALAEEGFFSGYDIVSANLEGAVTDLGEHYPPANKYDFAFDPYDIKALNEYYFNYFSIANNHINDQGKRGVDETIKNLSELGFLFSGSGDGQLSSRNSTSTLAKGRRVALLSFSAIYRSLPEEALVSAIGRAAADSDLVVVNVHWGVEYEHQALPKQRELAAKMAAAGADLIIGHHPHVVQGVELIGRTPVFYSLGNFIFDQFDTADTQEELGVAVAVFGDRLEVKMLPLRSEKMKLRSLRGEELEKFFERLSAWSFGDAAFKDDIRDGRLEIDLEAGA